MEMDEPEPRILPVIILADTSASMSVDGKIDVLNDTIPRMIAAFKALDIPGAVVKVGVIQFGGESASLHLPLTDVDAVSWRPLETSGRTPMGHAFTLAGDLLNDEVALPSRSYQPNLVLVSDGIPTDEWQVPLANLNTSRRAGRALRFAVSIGSDQKLDVLKLFAGAEGQVVPAERVELLTEFFKYVTYTVTRSATRMAQSQAALPTFKDYPADDVVEF